MLSFNEFTEFNTNFLTAKRALFRAMSEKYGWSIYSLSVFYSKYIDYIKSGGLPVGLIYARNGSYERTPEELNQIKNDFQAFADIPYASNFIENLYYAQFQLKYEPEISDYVYSPYEWWKILTNQIQAAQSNESFLDLLGRSAGDFFSNVLFNDKVIMFIVIAIIAYIFINKK